MKRRFANIIASGTFDRLHCGHRQFLETAFDAAETVYCGLTDFEDYSQCSDKKLPFLIENYQKRLKNLQEYLQVGNYFQMTKIFTLKDKFGPTLESNFFKGIVVSRETYSGAAIINQKRKRLGLRPLEIILAETVRDTQKTMLSSSSIRLGRVNRNGINFSQLLPQKTLYLPTSQRPHFKRPLGTLLTGVSNHLSWSALKANHSIQKTKTPLVITVGDIATGTFLLNKIPFDLAIVDQKTRRETHVYLNRDLFIESQVFKAENPAGTISPSLTTTLTTIFNSPLQKSVLLIEGEEDLSVLPCILLAPLKTLIFYGQPFEGLVKIRVTEKIKEKAVKLLKRFIS